MGPEGAYYQYMLSDEEGEVSKQEWDKIRPGMVCSEAKSYDNLVRSILKLCDETSLCDFEDRMELNNIQKKIKYYEERYKGIIKEHP